MEKYNLEFNLREITALVLLRGLPGIGKTTWLKNQGIEFLVLSPDTFRLMYSAPIFNKNDDGTSFLVINQDVGKYAWKETERLTKFRLKNNQSTIIDACFMNNKTIDRFKEMAKRFNVKLFIVDFGNDKELARKRNENRKGSIFYVPESVIDRMYKSGLEQDLIHKYNNDEYEMVVSSNLVRFIYS